MNDFKDSLMRLLEYTTPSGFEDKLVDVIDIKLDKDKYGNYYRIIGNNPLIMFNSHLDNNCKEYERVIIVEEINENGDTILKTNGSTILGADDKAGVALMLYMIENNIPGLYYFFIKEEIGCIGSKLLSENISEFSYLSNISKCISFDRKGTSSIITKQSNIRTCTDNFANSLLMELNKHSLSMTLDDTGIYSDSMSFNKKIDDCTNISIGYNNEHTPNEYLNLTYLEKLAKACILIDWEYIGNISNRLKYIKRFDKFE